MAAAPGPEPRPPVSSPSSITPRDISGMWNFLQGIYRLSTPRPATCLKIFALSMTDAFSFRPLPSLSSGFLGETRFITL